MRKLMSVAKIHMLEKTQPQLADANKQASVHIVCADAWNRAAAATIKGGPRSIN